MTSQALIGLGSNLENPIAQIRKAIQRLAKTPGLTINAVSSLYQSPPLGDISQPDFINAAIAITTHDPPDALLNKMIAIEQAHHRQRSQYWGPRTLDLDLLWVENVTLQSRRLTLPHPGLIKRDFVLCPLAEIVPHLVLCHEKTVQYYHNQLPSITCHKIMEV